ncbi:ribonuclease Z [Euzebyella marina]|uniref:Ribonuclease Z n=1 Tax=Euzebyella marina TaxID=1761453 RepID=A0A3G2L4P3_9FLAO|nr:ribonuclease Z [Euzebyella marina]AYN67156.1 ribonuclease Z [Euzebyella marina]MAU70511.1 ribonuclease Z [Pseudozobellia sp.]MBG49016.1 ribonuclease Z [Pseudozobellia sp.]|tara:strand:- start:54893 stop:55225 length:333 start_codon:yes stop_codon:yes gene_type:complete
MIFDSDGSTTIVFQEKTTLSTFLNNLNEAYPKIKNEHIIVNLFSFSKLKADDVLEFLQLSDLHKKSNKSFVLVTDKVSYDDVPDKICVVPTIQEAHDIIEMEEIERDLEL